MIAHTLGNPFDLDAVRHLRSSTTVVDRRLLRRARRDVSAARQVGTFGDLATLTFYPAHHITMGEGGAVLTNSPIARNARRIVPRLGTRLLVRAGQGQHLRQALRLAVRRPAVRLRSQVHLLAHRLQPEGDRHAGRDRLSQLQKLDGFIAARRENFARLTEAFVANALDEHFILPKATPDSEPSWFGFLLTIRDGSPLKRREVVTLPRE